MIISIVIIGMAFIWLLWETKCFTIRLSGKIRSMVSHNGLLSAMMGMIGMVVGHALFSAIFPRRHDPFPSALIDPSGKRHFGFTANQCRHICQKAPNWLWEYEKVTLISPQKITINSFDGLRAERICRHHPGWTWEEMQGRLIV